MASSSNPLISAVGSAVGAAAAGPVAAISATIGKIIDLFPSAETKLQATQLQVEATQHVADLQNALALAQLDAVTKQAASAAQMAQGDKSLWWVRSFFCITITLLYVWNYAGCRFFHQQPYDFPTTLHFIFAGIMLGLTGAPTALQALQNVIGMVPGIMQLPGESSVSVMGVKVGNKSQG